MTYSRTETYTYSNCVVRVHFPDLTEDERKRRTEHLKKATANFMKAVMKGEKKD